MTDTRLAAEVLLFLREEKLWILGPILVVAIALSTVLIVAEGSALSPFLYSFL